MLKRLAIPAVAVLLVTAIAVAVYHQQRHAVGEGYDVKCTQPNVPASALAEFVCKIQPSQDTEQGHPNRQWWYVLLAWPEGITAWLLLLTLGAIVWQAWETRKAAQSTESSALAFVTSQGPQILVTAHGNPPHDFMGEPPYVQMELQNQGPTTARNLNYEFWIEVLPFDQDRPDDFTDFTDAVYHYVFDHCVSVYPKQQPIIIHIPLNRNLEHNERGEILHLQKRLCIRIRVTYLDTFSALRQYADFGYWLQKDGLGFLPKYNDSGIEKKRPKKPN